MANVQKLKENLEKNGFKVSYYETAAEATAALTAEIKGKTIGMGGSCTLDEMGLFDALSAENQVFWHWKQPAAEARANAATAQIYMTSANGVAETGEIINIDGTGNRISAYVCDKEKVYIIIGVNKIAPDFHGALMRARNIAAPLNARRLNRQTPCAMGEEIKCYDCNSPQRICRGVSLLWRNMGGVGEMEVVIVNEKLGY